LHKVTFCFRFRRELAKILLWKKIAHKAKGFAAAAEWDIRQQTAMTPQEQIRVARELQRKAYPSAGEGLREWRKKS
jgi:hypothetical protein